MTRWLILLFEVLIQEAAFWIGFEAGGLWGGVGLLILFSVGAYVAQYLAERRGIRAALAQSRLIEDLDTHGPLAAQFLNGVAVPDHFLDEQYLRRQLRAVLAELATRTRIKPPALLLVDDSATGFHLAATFPFPPRPLILVTRELAARPDPALRAALAHELAHCLRPHGRARIMLSMLAMIAGPLIYGLVVRLAPIALLIPKATTPLLGFLVVRLVSLDHWEPEADRLIRRLGADPAALADLLVAETKDGRFDRPSRWLVTRRLKAFIKYDGVSFAAKPEPADSADSAELVSEAKSPLEKAPARSS